MNILSKKSFSKTELDKYKKAKKKTKLINKNTLAIQFTCSC